MFLASLLLGATGPLARGSDAPAPQKFYSPFLGDDVVAYPRVFWKESGEFSEAELFVLPFMQAHRALFKGKVVMDMGTGSGIIALYAAKLGAAKVIATDINPRAVQSARENAERLGFGSVIETRLVKDDNPGPFAALLPGEAVDVVVSNPWYQLGPELILGDPQRPENSNLDFGLSILDGLDRNLSRGGSAILLYRSKYLHEIMVRYARYLGFDVRHHEATILMSFDYCTLSNSVSAQIARRKKIEPKVLLYSDRECAELPWMLDEPNRTKTDEDKDRAALGDDLGRSFPGLILIQRQAAK